jgi:hypothetical protein
MRVPNVVLIVDQLLTTLLASSDLGDIIREC